MTNYLEVTNLSKSFDSFQLHNISFTLPKGYIMGLIGPNGSGKTTTIKLILNMLKRTGGTVKVMGLDNIAEEQKVKSELGVVFDTNYFSDDWKVSQVEKSISVFYPNWDSQKFADMLRKFHIAPTKKVKELSKGMQMKLMLACAFSYDAKLLILDEPTSGLDPVSRDELLKILSEYIEDGEHSVLFSTHITGDLERAADYITYISYGELYFTGSRCFFYDIKEKKLEQKGTVSYTSSHPLTLYSTRNDKIYYSAFSGEGKGNQIYLDNNETGEKKTDQFCDFNYLIQCGEQYFMAAELLNHYCIEPIVCDAEFQNCSRVMFDKKDDRFTWMVSTVPKENKIVFSHYSDNEMREANDVEGGNAPSKIAMLDLETKKTETVYETKYYIDGIACEGKYRHRRLKIAPGCFGQSTVGGSSI